MDAQHGGKICIVCHREFANDVNECPFDLVRLSERDSRIGTIFDGKYEIMDFIGVGGLSRVYKARHKELNRIFALKILKSSELIDLQRFRREAVSVGQLEHENIVRVYSFAVSPQGNPYMAQEYLEGRDLADVLAKQGPLSPDLAVSIFIQVAEALEHAHSRKIIHRDIKPGNIVLLNSDGGSTVVKVVDFGMAKLHLESGSSSMQKLTQEGEIFGTKQYISPEQYRGQEADEKADVYAFGITMYECLLKDGKLPDIFRSFIARATESIPEQRIQSAKDLKAELQQMKYTLRETGMYYVDARQGAIGKRDLFGTFYFWSMLVGMAIVGISATVVVKQRIATLEEVARPGKKTVLTRIAPLSLAAAQDQADSLVKSGQVEAGIKVYTDWIKRNEKIRDRWEGVCIASRWLGSLQSRLNRMDEAYDTLQSGLKLAEKHGEPEDSKNVLELKTGLAAVVGARKQYKQSMVLSNEVIAASANPPMTKDKLDYTILSYFNICRCLIKLQKYDEAETAAKTGLRLIEGSDGVDSVPYGEGTGLLADIYIARNDFPNALAAADKMVTCYRRFGHAYENPYLLAVITRAQVEMRMNKKADVEQDYKLVMESLKRSVHTHPGLENELRTGLRRLAVYLHREDDLENLQPIPLQ